MTETDDDREPVSRLKDVVITVVFVLVLFAVWWFTTRPDLNVAPVRHQVPRDR